MDRKEIVKKLEEISGNKAKYMGAPGFLYQIDINGKVCSIDKDGIIKTTEDQMVELESLMEQNPKMEPVEYIITIPMAEHTGVTLKNLVNMVYKKQQLIKKSIGLEADLVQQSFIDAINLENIQTRDEFLKQYMEFGKGCPGLGFDEEEGGISFKLEKELEPELLDAVMKLIAQMSMTARTLKHTATKQSDTENEKFAMRTWLVRLGFIGDEYKAARKVLLKPLEGNGAFRTPADSEKHKARISAKKENNQMFVDKKIVEYLQKQYPADSRVELIHMDDNQAPPVGTFGTVIGVDDIGSIMVTWDNGSSLNVVYGEDSCRKIK